MWHRHAHYITEKWYKLQHCFENQRPFINLLSMYVFDFCCLPTVSISIAMCRMLRPFFHTALFDAFIHSYIHSFVYLVLHLFMHLLVPLFFALIYTYLPYIYLLISLVTKGSVSYLSLLSKAYWSYCRQGHASGPDFGVLCRENDVRGGGPLLQRLGSPLVRLFEVCV